MAAHSVSGGGAARRERGCVTSRHDMWTEGVAAISSSVVTAAAVTAAAQHAAIAATEVPTTAAAKAAGGGDAAEWAAAAAAAVALLGRELRTRLSAFVLTNNKITLFIS